jgi:hypothetical protein
VERLEKSAAAAAKDAAAKADAAAAEVRAQLAGKDKRILALTEELATAQARVALGSPPSEPTHSAAAPHAARTRAAQLKPGFERAAQPSPRLSGGEWPG